MGALVTVMVSPQLPDFHVPPRVAALLIANGWQPPPSPIEHQDPAGSFLLPERLP